MLLVLIVIGTAVSPVFLSGRNFTNLTAAVIEVAIMALPMALVIIAGEIDLSVESMAGLAVRRPRASCGVPACRIEVGDPDRPRRSGALGGLLNGAARDRARPAVARRDARARWRCSAGSPSSSSARKGVSGFPDWFTTFGFGTVPGTPIPWPFLIFIGLAVVLGVVLHATWLGRQLYAIGKNASAARYSGVRVARLKLLLFVLSRRRSRRSPASS